LSAALRGVQLVQNLRGLPLPARGAKSSPHLGQVLVWVAVSGKARPVALRPWLVAGERVKGGGNADLCAADFCRFAGQGLCLGKSPLRFTTVAGLGQGLADYQPSLATSSKRATASSNGNLPASGGSSPGFHFPAMILRVFLAAAKDFGWGGAT